VNEAVDFKQAIQRRHRRIDCRVIDDDVGVTGDVPGITRRGSKDLCVAVLVVTEEFVHASPPSRQARAFDFRLAR
jgi:hypothetical protein